MRVRGDLLLALNHFTHHRRADRHVGESTLLAMTVATLSSQDSYIQPGAVLDGKMTIMSLVAFSGRAQRWVWIETGVWAARESIFFMYIYLRGARPLRGGLVVCAWSVLLSVATKYMIYVFESSVIGASKSNIPRLRKQREYRQKITGDSNSGN